MNYTIATTTDINFEQEVSFDKSGNKYVVYLMNKENGERASKQFDKIEEATAAYMKIVEAFLTGCYSWKDRAGFLK